MSGDPQRVCQCSPQEGQSPAPEQDMDRLCRDSDPAGSRGLCSGNRARRTAITACAPGCVHRIPAVPAAGSGLCSQLPIGKRCQPVAHAVPADRGTRHCLFGTPCAGGRAGRQGGTCPLPWTQPLMCPLLRSPSPGSGSLARQPSRWAEWPCPWSSRPGTEGGTGVAPWHRTSTRSCLSLPRGCPEALLPLPTDSALQEHGCFLCQRCRISLPTFPTSLLGGCTCGEGAAGRAGTPGQPPGNQGLSPQP